MMAMKLRTRLRDVLRDVLRPTIFDPHDKLRPASELALGLLTMPFELRDYLHRSPDTPATSRSASCQPANLVDDRQPAAAAAPTGYVYALEAEALREGRPLRVEIDGHELALYRVGETFYASDDACPHADGPLSEGDQEGDSVICPLHGWAFDLKSGRCTNIDSARLRVYPCRQVGEALYVALDGDGSAGNVSEAGAGE